MVRHERLAETRGVHQVCDGAFARREYLEEAESRFVAQRAESECGDGAGSFGHVRHGRNINNYLYYANTCVIVHDSNPRYRSSDSVSGEPPLPP